MMYLSSWLDKEAQPMKAGSGLTKTMAPRTRETLTELPLPRFDLTETRCIETLWRSAKEKRNRSLPTNMLCVYLKSSRLVLNPQNGTSCKL